MEIGNSISHFGIVSAQVVFILVLFALSNMYTKDIQIGSSLLRKQQWWFKLELLFFYSNLLRLFINFLYDYFDLLCKIASLSIEVANLMCNWL